MKCDHAKPASICHLCTHAEKHQQTDVWKEPGKKCDQTHKCEATGKMVQCTEEQ